MSKSLRLLAATLLTALAASAHADFVYTSQGVDFTYHGVDADTFTLRIQNALGATGNWAPATNLGELGFKGLGALSGLTGINVGISPAPSSAIQWTYTRTELTGSGCNANGNSQALCLDANPDLPLSNDLLLTIDLLGKNIDISGVTAPELKVGFTAWRAASGKPGSNGYKPAGYYIVGDLLSHVLTTPAITAPINTAPTNALNDAPSNNVPEPATLALAGLALAGAALVRRRSA